MEGLLIFLGFIAFVFGAAIVQGRVALWLENVRVGSLADLPCPRCGTLIGMDEANAAYDRAHQFSKDHTLARTSSEGYSSAPVYCRHCSAQLLYWVATRSLVVRDEDRSQH